MSDFTIGDRVYFNGETCVVEMVICARVYIRSKNGRLHVPRGSEIKPIKTCYAVLGGKS